ncbi:hypothetical protein ThrDRAFT_03512 [Frankia casuarinae]|nr:hypothetical protein CcI6DRAFT_04579 [Frankia sp. CcI6]EYT90864.1 hypothetical protein ThrDRAFT_03512 [Frankia casuarinae]KDA41850.1 hypothetical protein BMG523Draft_03321 [Frankia sp. BMG5.23]KEZ35359.1 hypothetical protein CEDDRAFT_03290 [Frankia sp. CeD]KFB02751.1 hypothetical protein ALLO2DRAFT_04501 [Frankia sp. Allo2]
MVGVAPGRLPPECLQAGYKVRRRRHVAHFPACLAYGEIRVGDDLIPADLRARPLAAPG